MSGSLRRQELIAVGLVMFGILMRTLPHVPNFSPMIGIAVFSGFYLRRGIVALLVPLSAAVISDMIIGFYDPVVMGSVWLSYVAMAVLIGRIMQRGSILGGAFGGLAGAVLFFVVTNFAVWLSGTLYPFSVHGLLDCYVSALPFFRATLLSAVAYSAIFFGMHQLAVRFKRVGTAV
jgi:hypothetical protein